MEFTMEDLEFIREVLLYVIFYSAEDLIELPNYEDDEVFKLGSSILESVNALIDMKV